MSFIDSNHPPLAHEIESNEISDADPIEGEISIEPGAGLDEDLEDSDAGYDEASEDDEEEFDDSGSEFNDHPDGDEDEDEDDVSLAEFTDA